MTVALLGSWLQDQDNTIGMNLARGFHTAEAGSDRMLVVVAGNEQGSVANADHHVTDVTYGGVAMTLAGIATTQIGTTSSHSSIWYLLETGIVAATSNEIIATYVIDSPPESAFLGAAVIMSAFHSGVDQTSPLVDSDATSSTVTNPLTLTLTTLSGGLLIAATAAGNDVTYAWTNATEQLEVPTGFGFTLCSAAASTTGSDISPVATLTGTLNRHLLVAATFKAAGGDKTVNVTGNSAAGSVGTPSLAITTNPAVTGNAATGATGTTTPGIDKGVTGQAATGSVGTVAVTLSSNASVTGNAATGSTGAIVPAIDKAVTGNAATGAVGTVTALSGATVNVTGNAGTGSTGATVPNVLTALAGNAGTGAVGTTGPAVARPVTGNAGTGAVGTMVPSIQVSPTGNFATGAVGTISVTAGGNATVPVTGNAATGAVGTVSIPSAAAASRALGGMIVNVGRMMGR